MNQPVVFAIVSMACYGLTDFIYKLAAGAAIRADRLLMVQSWFWWLLVTPYALATHTLVLAPAAMWGLLAGAFSFGGVFLFIRSLTAGSISTNAPIFRLNFIVTAFLVIALLGEPLTPGKIIGLALALIATWLLMGTDAGGDPVSIHTRRRSVVQVAGATLAFGASNYFHTIGLRHGAVPETLAVAAGTSFGPLATLVVYLAQGKLRSSPVTIKYAAVSAVVMVGATVFLLRGVALGQASVLVPITQMGFVISALLGVLLLGERITARKAVGLVSALAALAVLVRS